MNCVVLIIVLELILVCTLVSCNKGAIGKGKATNIPTSYPCDGDVLIFSGTYPDGWPKSIEIMEGSYVDHSGKIATDTAGKLYGSALIKGSHDEILEYYRKELKENGYAFQELPQGAFLALRVLQSPGVDYYSIRIGYNGELIDKSPGINPKDWVWCSFHVYPNKAPK